MNAATGVRPLRQTTQEGTEGSHMAEMTAVAEEDMIRAEMESCGGFQRGQGGGDRGGLDTGKMDSKGGPREEDQRDH